ncbi:hypothetical protein C8J57DRAFT_1599085 [Mycena rebaudengoi]|nr:hypothetical protein C8J57DRAFT_1599085 [Mycena rebaudengoi]
MPDSNAKPQHTPSVRTWNATIAEASHDVLIEHRNLDHIALFQAYRKLQNDNANAAAAYSILQARFETLQFAYSNLTSAVSDRLSSLAVASTGTSAMTLLGSSSSKPLEILAQEDYPKVKFWTEQSYFDEKVSRKKANGKASMSDAQNLRGSRRLSNNENVMCWYIETAQGEPVPGSRAKVIRDQARKLWAHLHQTGNAPLHWEDATSHARDYYACEMYHKYPELRLCDDDYKVHRIATQCYPGWAEKYFPKHGFPGGKTVKDEDGTEADTHSGLKREASTVPESAVPPAKKQKREEQPVDAPPPVEQKAKATKKPSRPKAAPSKRSHTRAAAAPHSAPGPTSPLPETTPSAPGAALSTSEPVPAAPEPVIAAPKPAPEPSRPQPRACSKPSTSSTSAPPRVSPAVSGLSDINVEMPPIPMNGLEPDATMTPALSLPQLSKVFPSVSMATASTLSDPFVTQNILGTGAPRAASVVHSLPPQVSTIVPSPPIATGSTLLTPTPLTTKNPSPSTTSTPAQVDNPLAAFAAVVVSTEPSARSQFVDKALEEKTKKDTKKIKYLKPTKSFTPRNLCLMDYVKNKGQVTKEVFDDYWAKLRPEDRAVFEKRSAAATVASKLAAGM